MWEGAEPLAAVGLFQALPSPPSAQRPPRFTRISIARLNKGKSSIFNIRSTSSNPGCQGEQLQHLQQQHHISTATAECYQQQPPRFTQTRIAGMNIEQREQHVYNRIRTDLVRTRGATAIIGTCLPQADFQKEQRTTMTNLTISPSQSAIWKKGKLSWMTSYSFSTS